VRRVVGIQAKLLLDTHVLLWSFTEPDRLSAEIRDRIADPETTVAVSAASTWEIAIKVKSGKLRFDADLERAIEDYEYEPLPVTIPHVIAAGSLPLLHKDPFDRLLVAQAMTDGWTLVTRDIKLQGYGAAVLQA
jgi:PIN domain nuclease of toxin-antitoxin system